MFCVKQGEGKIYAPADGKTSQLTDTLHAVGIEAGGGNEILIRVGVDTVEMKGDGFTARVKQGQNVKKGDLLPTMNLSKISAVGYAATVIMAVVNMDDFASIDPVASGTVQPGDAVFRIFQ